MISRFLIVFCFVQTLQTAPHIFLEKEIPAPEEVDFSSTQGFAAIADVLNNLFDFLANYKTKQFVLDDEFKKLLEEKLNKAFILISVAIGEPIFQKVIEVIAYNLEFLEYKRCLTPKSEIPFTLVQQTREEIQVRAKKTEKGIISKFFYIAGLCQDLSSDPQYRDDNSKKVLEIKNYSIFLFDIFNFIVEHPRLFKESINEKPTFVIISESFKIAGGILYSRQSHRGIPIVRDEIMTRP